MANLGTTKKKKSSRKKRPALSPEARENQLINEAYDLVEERFQDGTATAQETVHFLRLGSQKNQMEMEKLRKENELLSAKTDALQSAKRVEELYADALSAMRLYSGQDKKEESVED